MVLNILLICVIFSCKKENLCDCVKSTGDIKAETRSVVGFDSIYVTTNVNVILTTDSISEVKVEAGENLLSLIKTEVRGKTLYISNNNKCNFMRSYDIPMNVYIRKSDFKGIQSYGSGFISSTNTIYSDTIDINVRGSGDVNLDVYAPTVLSHMHGIGDLILSGWAGVHQVYSTGNNFIRCADLETGYTFMWTDLTGHSYVKVTKVLSVTLSGSGNIYYTGDPYEITADIIGSGKLIKVN